MTELYLSHEESAVRVLGPGLRYVIWVQGCRKNCPGCIFPEGRSLHSNGYHVSVEELAERILANAGSLRGITISGGEPFLQAVGLCKLVKRARQESRLDVMLYSGYTLEELRSWQDGDVEDLLANTDILIDGEYLEDRDMGHLYRGSDNQGIHFLSPRYLPFREQMLATRNRNIEFFQRGDELFMAGIPAKNFLNEFAKTIHSIKDRQ